MGFMDLLQSHYTDESLLRTVSFLLNLRQGSLSVPGTSDGCHVNSFSNCFSETAGELTVAIEALMHHGNADVRQQAGRLLVMLSAP